MSSAVLAPPRPATRAGYGLALLAAGLGLGTVTAYSAPLGVAAVLVCALVVAVVLRPALAGYLLVGVTPLVAGIDRGNGIPMFRPGEALALLLGAALLIRGLLRLRTGAWTRPRIHPIEIAIVLMAVANSVTPLLWMLARDRPISQDDLLYALVMWKFLGLYVVVRVSVTNGEQVHRCLWIALAVGAVVAVVWGWGVAQHPYLLPKELTIDAGAAPSDTLTSVLIVFGFAVALVGPSLALLYTLAQKGMIEE